MLCHYLSQCRLFRWLSARLQYLLCISNGDIVVLHWTIYLSIEHTIVWNCNQNLSISRKCVWMLSAKCLSQCATAPVYSRKGNLWAITFCSHFRWDASQAVTKETASLLEQPPQPETDPSQVLTHTMYSVVEADLCPGVVSVCGVLLPVFKTDSVKVGLWIVIIYIDFDCLYLIS